jgi:hypothetical protein
MLNKKRVHSLCELFFPKIFSNQNYPGLPAGWQVLLIHTRQKLFIALGSFHPVL